MEAFKGQTYRSLDAIQITGNIKLRKIFTTNNLLIETDTKEEQNFINLLPRNFSFPVEVFNCSYFVKFSKNVNVSP
jgi:hypothetical protein